MEVVGPGELSHFGPHTVTNHQHTGLTNAPLTPLLFQVREDDDNDTLPSSVELDDERKLFVPLFAPTVGSTAPGRRSSAALSVVDPVGQRPAPPPALQLYAGRAAADTAAGTSGTHRHRTDIAAVHRPSDAA